MSNTLWKIRFSNYEPIDLRDIESYSIEQNVVDTSPIKEGEMNEEIEKKFKDSIFKELNIFFGGIMNYISWSEGSKYSEDKNYGELYKRGLYCARERYEREPYFKQYFKDIVVKYLIDNKKVFTNIEKWQEKLSFAKENIFEHLPDYDKKVLKEYLILEKREKLFTVEFYLKDETTVKWGAYKTEKEAKIVYNKVDTYFKKTFDNFYKNLDNQEIYSL